MTKYPLQELVFIKQKKLEEAEKILKEKKEALRKEEEKLKAVEKERDEVKEHREEKLSQLRHELDTGTTSPKVQQMKSYLKVVEEKLKTKEQKVEEQKKVVAAAEKVVDAAREEMLKRQHDVEKLQTHRKAWEKEIQAEADRKEGLETDEMGSATHYRRKKRKET